MKVAAFELLAPDLVVYAIERVLVLVALCQIVLTDKITLGLVAIRHKTRYKRLQIAYKPTKEKVTLELDVVVNVDLGRLPAKDLKAFGWQWL